jgi:hypothetical protein
METAPMKIFTQEEIDRTRAFCQGRSYPLQRGELEGKVFHYFVLPRTLEPRLRYFASRLTGENSTPEDPKTYLLGVSDEVPREFREEFVKHEYDEFLNKLRCAEAATRELARVPAIVQPKYLPLRIALFTDLIPYAKGQPESYTPDDIEHFNESLQVFEERMKKVK